VADGELENDIVGIVDGVGVAGVVESTAVEAIVVVSGMVVVVVDGAEVNKLGDDDGVGRGVGPAVMVVVVGRSVVVGGRAFGVDVVATVGQIRVAQLQGGAVSCANVLHVCVSRFEQKKKKKKKHCQTSKVNDPNRLTRQFMSELICTVLRRKR
jgi:glycerol uptake facilitator-like aquaporin